MRRISMKKILPLALVACCALLGVVGCDKKDETSYSIVGEYDPATNTFRGKLDLSFVNGTGTTLETLCFQLYPNAYREGASYQPISLAYRSAYYDKLDYGNISIKKVDGGEYIVGGADETLLIVDIPDLADGKRTNVSIEFETKLAKVNHRLGVGQTNVNLANFYPILCVYDEGWQECLYYNVGDPFYSDFACYDVELSVPKSYTVASSGTLCCETNAGEKKTCHITERGRDVSFVLGEKLSSLSEEVKGKTLSYYYTDDENAKVHFDLMKECFSYYTDTFGECIYPSLTLVQTDFPFAGMEYAGLMMMSNDLAEETISYAIAHELAHEWWYEGVGNDQRTHAWMDEGLAEYSCVLFFENHDYGFTREGVLSTSKKAIRSYVSIYSQLFGETNTSIDRDLSTFMSEYEYSNLVYNQGIVLFDGLRESIGDKRFLNGLSSYYSGFVEKIATPEDLISSFRHTGVDVDGLFESFINGKVVI